MKLLGAIPEAKAAEPYSVDETSKKEDHLLVKLYNVIFTSFLNLFVLKKYYIQSNNNQIL